VKILPIDSEQSAIWQCLAKEDKRALKRIYLTASGGPFRKTSRSLFKKIELKQVLKHPRWNMGRKITVDSATLMNKGFELLEAMALFDLSSDKVSILIHPEAICHSMVEFNDGVVMAQLSATDMRIPIQYALTFPDRLESGFSGIDFCALKSLNFEKPDFKKFPCLGLSLKAARMLGTMPAVLNAANEVAVNEFLAGNLRFFLIPGIVRTVMNRHKNIINPSLAQILDADAWAKQQAAAVIGKL
jgi:1-deoxy-D-xylulose-5-phosphate reductoisomerase